MTQEDDNISLDKRIRERLPCTWVPFFSRFGKLTDIQRETIPLIIDGLNVVVTSPKATGKTEAVLAPVVERWLKRPSRHLSIIYISPTRALVNDIYKRMRSQLNYLDIPVSRRTGDHPEFKKDKITPLLITTPESLDSLISRYPSLFTLVDTVIIDEVHLMYDSYRGDQLRILLRRLKRITKKTPNIYVMSATICDAKRIGEKFIEDKFRTSSRKVPLLIEYYLIDGENFIDKIKEDFRFRNLKKILLFTNSRYEAEETAKLVSPHPFGRNTWVHHGSMSKGEREEVERAFNTTKTGVCVATSTLEFGIDIGDIDATVLLRPPPNAASLLQRMGRGNRRKENYVLAYGVYLDDIQKVIFEQLFEDAQNERYLTLHHSFDISVACQQIFSYLHQKLRVGTSNQALKRLFAGIVEDRDIDEILHALLDKNLIETGKSGLLYPGEKIQGAIVRGNVHSNIPDGKEFEVYDASTGRAIGRIDNPFPSFTLGGRDWLVVSCESNRVWVKYQGKGNRARNVFMGRQHGFWDFIFGSRMKKRFFPHMAENEIPYILYGDYYHIYHFAGPIYGYIWSYALGEKIEIGEVGDIVFVSDSLDIIPSKGDIVEAVNKTVSALSHYMNPGRYYPLLPRDIRQKQMTSFLNIDHFADWLSKINLVNVSEILSKSQSL